MCPRIKKHLTLDYDLWAESKTVIRLIKIKLKWKEVDSHIEHKVYIYPNKTNGGKYSIGLNRYMDARAWDLSGDEQSRDIL